MSYTNSGVGNPILGCGMNVHVARSMETRLECTYVVTR
jgi:hypothetical protein